MGNIEHPEDHDGTDSPTDFGKLGRSEWSRTEFLAEIDGLEELVDDYRRQLRGAVEALRAEAQAMRDNEDVQPAASARDVASMLDSYADRFGGQ